MTLAQDFAKTITDAHYTTGNYLTFNRQDVVSFLEANERPITNSSGIIAELVNNGLAKMVKSAKRGKGGYPADYELKAIADMEAQMTEDDKYSIEIQSDIEVTEKVNKYADGKDLNIDTFEVVHNEPSNPDDILKLVNIDSDTNSVQVTTARDKIREMVYARFGKPDEQPGKSDAKRQKNDAERQKNDRDNKFAIVNALASSSVDKAVRSLLRGMVADQVQMDDNVYVLREAFISSTETLAVTLDEVFEVFVDLLEQVTKNQNVVSENQRTIEKFFNDYRGKEAELVKGTADFFRQLDNRVEKLETAAPVTAATDIDISSEQLVKEYQSGYRDGYRDGHKTGFETEYER